MAALTLSKSPMDFMQVSYAYSSVRLCNTAHNSFDHDLLMSDVISCADRTKNARQCASAHCTNSMPVAFVAFSMLMPCFLRDSKC